MKTGDHDIRVLMYYRIGGIGKSTIINKLISEMKEQLHKLLYVYYDLGIKQDSRSVLESISNLLVGFANQLIKSADTGIIFIRSLLSNHTRELIEIENKSPTELYHLLLLFAHDYSKNSNEVTHDNQ